ncbi:MAG: FxsA family protein [Gammaproteobacteria bacterium]|nr:FxsA family protein [Gammaproteobacteria bacterium]
MPILPLFLVLFIGVPLIEIYLLIEVGGVIGALPTILAVLLTAILGVTLIRIQGFSTLQKAQASINQGIAPAKEIFEGIMLLFSALCLLIPGFFTDTIGFLLLIPPLRSWLASAFLNSRGLKGNISMKNAQGNSGDYIEGEYEDLTPEEQHERNQSRLKHQHIIEGSVDSSHNNH